MKLILITSVKEFESNIKDLLIRSGVPSFSHSRVQGFKTGESAASSENWFASQGIESDSVMFTVFADNEMLETISGRIRRFNAKQEFQTKIHMAALAIEQVV